MDAGSPSDAGPTCSSMSKALWDGINAAVEANNACAIDADCTTADQSTACQGACPAAINVAKKVAFGAAVDALDQSICKANNYAAKCGYATPKCMAPKPGCVAGKCVYNKPPTPPACKPGYFKAYGSDVCEEATCKAMATAKNTAINDAVKAAKACSADAECGIVMTGTQCGGTCGAAVNKAQAAAVTKVVNWVDNNICKPQGYPGKCGYATPGCMMPNPGCKAGECVYAK